ncbi:hypothetical protein MBLNU457_5451t1 [Dothideomycetes sp. NU457]
MSHSGARRAYSAEELLALRRSASDEPALAIQNNTRESAIKDPESDHVIRGARSFGSQASGSHLPSRTLPGPAPARSLAVPILGEIDPNNQIIRPRSSYKTSPTPSLKKRKAEQILEQHGSPPDLRVTAGGRIVPYNQSPLCSPRYGYSAIQKNGGLIKLAPGYPPPKTFQSFAKLLDNGFVAQEPSGRLCQLVDGRFLPVHEVNGIPQLYITAPNLNNLSSTKQNTLATAGIGKSPAQNATFANTVPTQGHSDPTIPAQLEALDKQYQKLEIERRSLDKAEVLQKMTGKSFNQLIQRRRNLIEQQNELRLSKKALEEAKANAETPITNRAAASSPEALLNPMHFPMHHGIPQLPMNVWNTDHSFTEPNPAALQGMQMPPDYGMFMPPPFYGAPMPPMGPVSPYFQAPGMMPSMFQGHGDFPGTGQGGPMQYPMPVGPDFVQQHNMLNTNSARPVSAQPTADKTSEGAQTSSSDNPPRQKSSLNPMSAVYEPSSKLNTPEKKPALSQVTAFAEAIKAHNDWAGSSSEATSSLGANDRLAAAQHSSESSYATADFFPQNPRDHSMNKQSYPVGEKSEAENAMDAASVHIPSSDDNQISPEKERHNPNWNPTIPDHAFKSTPAPNEQSKLGPAGTQDGSGRALTGPTTEPLDTHLHAKGRPGSLALRRTDTEMAVQGSPGIRSPVVDMSSGSAPRTTSGSHKRSQDYLEGFRAGLAREQVRSDKDKQVQGFQDFLDGYIAGLRRWGEVPDSMQENVSPRSKTTTSEVNISPSSSIAKRIERRSEIVATTMPTLVTKTEPLDTLKQAMFGPTNENAVLSPTEDAPPVFAILDKTFSSWSKNREPSLGADHVLSQLRNGQANFPERTSSMVHRQLSSASSHNVNQAVVPDVAQKQGSSSVSTTPADVENTARRDFSAATQPATGSSYLQHAYSGHRVMSSPALEWKAGSSIAQVAGLATGYFAQFDGTLTDLSNMTVEPIANRVTSTTSGSEQAGQESPRKSLQTHPRFKEATMSETDSPLTVQTTSPQVSPSKRTSPAKARFAQIAGKAGIKVGAQRREPNESDPEAMSPQERRKWRDLWKKRHAATVE